MKAVWLTVMALRVAACSSKPNVAERLASQNSVGRCMVLADALGTLQAGDPLPRVREVLGPPSRMHAKWVGFFSRGDVLEYDLGPSLCAKQLLGGDKHGVVQVKFDGKGRLVGYGGQRLPGVMLAERPATDLQLP